MGKCLLIVAGLFAFAVNGQGGNVLRLGDQAVKWKTPRLTVKISRTVHLAEGEFGVDRRDPPEVVHAAVAESVREWVEATGSLLDIRVELTDSTSATGADNVVTFTDSAPFDNGFCSKEFVACALLNYDASTGEILSASVAFNPYKRHSARGYEGTNDIGLVMLHEFGHALGLDHSALGDSIMAPSAELESTGLPGPRYAPRRLSVDDVATLRAAYGFTAGMARVEGAVRSGGQPVGAAHVMAMSEEGLSVGSAETRPDGSYRLLVPAGTYYLLVEPLDGPVIVGGPGIQTLFWTASGGDRVAGEAVTVGVDETRSGIDFTAGGGPTLNIVNIGIRANGRYAGFPRTTIARGQEYELGIGRTPAGTPGTVRLVRSAIELVGDPFPSATNANFLYQRIRVPKDMPLGAYTAEFATAEASAVVAGGVMVVSTPTIESVEGTAGPGQTITVRGTGLAARELARTPWMEGAPLPTQLAGTVVTANGAYCELVSVKPIEVVAILPFSVDPGKVTIAVLTGTAVQSNVWDLPSSE